VDVQELQVLEIRMYFCKELYHDRDKYRA
jgi:hypothetical protein